MSEPIFYGSDYKPPEFIRTDSDGNEVIKRQHEFPPITGYDVYRWPEFISLMGRLGFVWEISTVEITINFPMNESVTIEQTYLGRDTKDPNIKSDEKGEE